MDLWMMNDGDYEWWLYVLRNTKATSAIKQQVQFMKKLSNTEVELKKPLLIKRSMLPIWYHWSASNYMFKVNTRNTRTRCEIYSKLTIKIPERRRHWRLKVVLFFFSRKFAIWLIGKSWFQILQQFLNLQPKNTHIWHFWSQN